MLKIETIFYVVLVDLGTVQIIMEAYIITDVWNDASWGWGCKTNGIFDSVNILTLLMRTNGSESIICIFTCIANLLAVSNSPKVGNRKHWLGWSRTGTEGSLILPDSKIYQLV